MPLFNFLKKLYPGFPSEKINEDKIIAELYPGESSSGKKHKDLIRNIFSTLLKAVTDYIFYSNIKNDVLLKNRIIL